MPGTFPSSGCQLFLLRKDERWGAVIETILTQDGKCCLCVRRPLPCIPGVTRSTGKPCIYSSALQEETKDGLQDLKPRGLCRTCTRPAISKALLPFLSLLPHLNMVFSIRQPPFFLTRPPCVAHAAYVVQAGAKHAVFLPQFPK